MTSTIIVFGGGLMSAPCVSHLLANGYHVCVVDAIARDVSFLAVNSGGKGRVTFVRGDLGKTEEVRRVLSTLPSKALCAVSLLPPDMHVGVAAECIAAGVPFVSASYATNEMKGLADVASEQGVVLLNEMGLDPGMDLMSSAQLIARVAQEGGKVVHYSSLCGALCAPHLSNGPLGYRFSWSPKGVLKAITRPARFMSDGTWFDIDGGHLYHLVCPISDFKGLRLNWVPNGNAEPFVDEYFNINGPSLRTAVRGTLRYDGYGPVALAFHVLGLLCDRNCGALCGCRFNHRTWGEFLGAHIGCSTEEEVLEYCSEQFRADHEHIRSRGLDVAMSKVCFATDEKGNGASEAFAAPFTLMPVSESLQYVRAFLRETAFLTSPIPKSAPLTPIDALTTFLGQRLMLDAAAGETDFVSMIHRVVAVFPSGEYRTYESTYAAGGTPYGFSTVANTVGLTAACAAQSVANGRIAKPGLRNPCEPIVYGPVMALLAEARILFRERVVGGDLSKI